VYRHFWC